MTQPGKFGAPLGVVLAAVGVLAVAVGWNGAASQTTVVAQLPYVLSGGLVGLSLVVVGAALMVVTAAREDRARLEAKLDEVVEALAAAQAVAGSTPLDLAGLVVAGTASYHLPGCRLVDDREATAHLTVDEARARALKPCRVCKADRALV